MQKKIWVLSVLICITLLIGVWYSVSKEFKFGGRSANKVFADLQVANLVRAGSRGETDEMERLVKAGANVNYRGELGVTPIVWLAASRNMEGVAKLLELGADPNQKTERGDSAAYLLAGGDNLPMLELVLKNGGDPNIDNPPYTALQFAISQFREENMKLLIQYGADINKADQVDRTAAQLAAALGRFNYVAYLLDVGYSYKLERLLKVVNIRIVPEDSDQYQWKLKVIEMIEERGVGKKEKSGSEST